MDIKNFIEKFAEAVEIDNKNLIKEDTLFRKLPEWNSMGALAIIALADEEYGIEIEPEDIKNAQSIVELYEIIKSKKIDD